MTPRERLLTGAPFPALLRLAVPTLIASLVQSVMTVVEGWYAGTLGGAALAGVALVFPLLMLVQMLSAGAMGGAVSGAMARAIGAGDTARANAVLRVAVTLALGAGALVALVVWVFGAPIFRALGGEGAALEGALDYAGVLFPGIALVWLVNMLGSALRGTGDMVRPAVVIAVVVALHGAALAGLHAMDSPLGLAGAAWALLGAYAVGTVVLVVMFARRGRAVRLTLDAWPLTGGLRVLGAGLLAGSQSAMTVAYAMLATGVFARFGEGWLAGYGIGVRLELIVIPLIFGVGGAAMVATGTLTGAGRRADAVRIGWLSAALAAALVGALGLVVAIWPALWTGLFTDEPAIAAAADAYLSRVGPFYAFFGLGLCLYFASQGLQTLLFPVIGALVRIVAVGLGFWALGVAGALTPDRALWVVAAAMALYGTFNALALRLGPWSPRLPGRDGAVG